MGFRKFVQGMIEDLSSRADAETRRYQATERRLRDIERELRGVSVSDDGGRGYRQVARRIEQIAAEDEPAQAPRAVDVRSLGVERLVIRRAREMVAYELRHYQDDFLRHVPVSEAELISAIRSICDTLAGRVEGPEPITVVLGLYVPSSTEHDKALQEALAKVKEHQELIASIERMGGRMVVQRARVAARRPSPPLAAPPAAVAKVQDGAAVSRCEATCLSGVDRLRCDLPAGHIEPHHAVKEDTLVGRSFSWTTNPDDLDDAEKNAASVLAEAREASDKAAAGIAMDMLRKKNERVASAILPDAPAGIGQSRASLAGDVIRLGKLVVDRPPGYGIVPIIGDKPDLSPYGCLFAAAIEERYPVVLKADVLDAATLSPADRQVRNGREPRSSKPVRADQCRVSDNGVVVRVESISEEGCCELVNVTGHRRLAMSLDRATVEAEFPIVLVEPVVRRTLFDPAQRLNLGGAPPARPKDVPAMATQVAAPEEDLTEFARRVNDTVTRMKGFVIRVDGMKAVFIALVYREMELPKPPTLELFKKRVVEAQVAGLLVLERNLAVENTVLEAESAIRTEFGEWHFIQVNVDRHRAAPGPEEDLTWFAFRVIDAVARATQGVVVNGDTKKVLISCVFEQLASPKPSLDRFKERLVDAMRAGLLKLRPAAPTQLGVLEEKLRELPWMVESATQVLNMEVHFVQIEQVPADQPEAEDPMLRARLHKDRLQDELNRKGGT